MLEDAAARLVPVLKTLPAALLPLLTRGPGRPPIPDEPAAALLHPRRKALFRLVQREPGISIGELQRRLEIPSGAFHNHMMKLVAAGLVEKRQAGLVVHVYPTGAVPPPDAPALSNATAKEIARAVLEKPGLTSDEVAESAGKSQRTAQVYLRTLREEGYVQQHVGGLSPTYHPTAKLRRELRE